jgi:hypothetical protein
MNRLRSNAQLATVADAINAIKVSFALKVVRIDIAMGSVSLSSWLICSTRAYHL